MMDVEEQTFNQLVGENRHYCPEWDYMAIDESCPEFESCICYKTDP